MNPFAHVVTAQNHNTFNVFPSYLSFMLSLMKGDRYLLGDVEQNKNYLCVFNTAKEERGELYEKYCKKYFTENFSLAVITLNSILDKIENDGRCFWAPFSEENYKLILEKIESCGGVCKDKSLENMKKSFVTAHSMKEWFGNNISNINVYFAI